MLFAIEMKLFKNLKNQNLIYYKILTLKRIDYSPIIC
jgi:hypothetical protein